MSNELALTVSENVRIISSVVRSMEKLRSLGGTISPVKLLTCRAIPSCSGILLFPLMSSTVRLVITRYVFSIDVATVGSCFKMSVSFRMSDI